MTVPNPQLPQVHALQITKNGVVIAVSMDFQLAPQLRGEIMGRLKRVCEQPPAFYGEVTLSIPEGRTDAYATFQRPAGNPRIIRGLLRALAKEKFTLVEADPMEHTALLAGGPDRVKFPVPPQDPHPN